MLPEAELDTLQAYVLVKFDVTSASINLSMSYSGSSGCTGFFKTLTEAQHQQFLEKLTGNDYIVYCLDVPREKLKTNV